MRSRLAPTEPRVFLVGAGPGDPRLLTLRGADCLAQAEVVIYDYLVNPELLRHAPATSLQLCVGRHGVGHRQTQAEINQLMIAHAQAGKLVVRLKGGDPVVFGHLVDEAEALVAARIPFEIVPGITAALAAGSYAGIPLTHRVHSSALALVTGQEDSCKQNSALDFAAIAQFPGTLVFYMGVTTAKHWTSELIGAGKPAATPAAIIRRVSWADQEVIRTTLDQVATILAERKLRPPVIVVVGPVANLGSEFDWFEQKRLFGTSVLVTRPFGQVGSLADPLRTLGAEVLVDPAIEIGPPENWKPVDRALSKLGDFDWLIFTSTNGVQFFLNRLSAIGGDLRRLAKVRLAAVGPGTAEALTSYFLKADVIPSGGDFRSESLLAALPSPIAGARILLPRADRARELLGSELTAAGAVVEEVVCYANRPVTAANPVIAQRLADRKITWTTVTSKAIAQSLLARYGEALRHTRLASLSPAVSAFLREAGFDVAVEAQAVSMESLVEAIAADRDAAQPR